MNRISLVISDVDGTMVTHDKRLTDGAINAVKQLADKNIGFTVTSSRPAFGMRMLIKPLDLRLPFGAFNGSLIVDPTLAVLQKEIIPAPAARIAIDTLKASGVDIWLFTADRWLIMHDDGHYVAHEQATILTPQLSFPVLMNLRTMPAKLSASARTPRNWRVAKPPCRRRSPVKRQPSARKAIISTSLPPGGTRERSWKQWRSVSIFRQRTLPPSVTWRTIWPCSPKAACHLPWATPLTM